MAASPKRTEERQQLHDAIANLNMVKANIADARAAVEKAFENWMTVDRKVDALEAEMAESGQAASDHLVRTLLADGDVAELERPATALRDKIEAARAEREAWANAGEVAKSLAAQREASLEWAVYIRDQGVAAVVASEIEPAPLVAEIEQLQVQLVGKRALLAAIANCLPTEGRRQIEVFLSRGPPATTGDAAERFKDYLKALATDADAKPPTA
jgi:hypothetical protein